MIREHVPDVAITTDVIAGFPGETDEDFEATYNLCEEVAFAQMHCFPYSRRPHTGAEKMSGHLGPQIRRERLERLLMLAGTMSQRFRGQYLAQVADVLWERDSEGVWEGLTGNYIRVYASAEHEIENQLLPARLDALEGDGMRGSLLTPTSV
jgi:threonylcarbamoyladenosine tRNA methylthiotransferase MtaB